MNKWIRIILCSIAVILYFGLVLKSDNLVSAIIKIIVVALLLLGMEAVRRDREKVFVIHSDVGQLKAMENDQFIEYSARLYKKLGYYIDLVKTDQKLGCDLIARKKQEVICIRCISEEKEIDLLPLQEVYGSKNLYKANRCLVITPYQYTIKAKQFAKANHIELVDQTALIKLISKALNGKQYPAQSASTQEV